MKHTRRICLLLAVLFMLTAIFTACEPGTDTETDEATDGGKEKDKDKDKSNPYADDDTVYHTKYFAGDCVYYANYEPISGQGSLVFTLLDFPGDVYHACQNPTCYHNREQDCPLFSIDPFCVVQREGELPLVYMLFHFSSEVRVYDSKNAATKRLGMTDFVSVRDSWFYRGKLYMWSSSIGVPGRPSTGVRSLDAVTGEFQYLDIDVKASMLGIWRDRVWYITDRNVICSCDLDFSDQREEYDIGIEETMYDTNEYTLIGYIDNGMIYFERNCREPEKFDGDAFINNVGDGYTLRFATISDIYMLDADNIDAGERLVAEGVYSFKTHNGDLYYTKFDYDNYEESETYTYTKNKGTGFESQAQGKTYKFDGGTLYRYEHESGKSVTVVEDCGTNFSTFTLGGWIYDITDDYVLFGGRQYRDLNDELKDRDCCNSICLLDLKTGDWRVIVPRTNIPFNEVY